MTTLPGTPRSRRPTLRLLPLILLGLAGCGPSPDPRRPPLPKVARVPIVSTTVTPALEAPGTLVVADGTDCGESDRSGTEQMVELAGSYALPAYADRATVMLNGWKMEYKNGDHHVRWLAATIDDVALAASTLSWAARGGISDKNFDDAYEFCYTYTVIAWNSGLIDATTGPGATTQHDNFTGLKDTTALTASFGQVESDAFVGKTTVALLPRGFTTGFANQSWAFPWDLGWPPACFDCAVDHHLLQFGHQFDHSAPFLETGRPYDSYPQDPPQAADASLGDARFQSWNGYTVLKDNASRRDDWIEEYVSSLAGNDIAETNPPFTILPREDMGWFGGCLGEAGGVKAQDVEIRDLPYEYAVPILSGWEIGYGCDDEHVAEIGVWLEDAVYDKPAGETRGTLSYKLMSILRDEDGQPGHYIRHKIRVLGINARQPTDLVPRSANPQFCDRDSLGRLQFLVANIGADRAPATVTRVRFAAGATVDVPTPPIPKGATISIDPVTIPAGACSGDCSFTVNVDADAEAEETDEANNVAGGLCIG